MKRTKKKQQQQQHTNTTKFINVITFKEKLFPSGISKKEVGKFKCRIWLLKFSFHVLIFGENQLPRETLSRWKKFRVDIVLSSNLALEK